MKNKKTKSLITLCLILSLLSGFVTPVTQTRTAKAAKVYGDTLKKLKKNKLKLGKKKTMTSTMVEYTRVWAKRNKLVADGPFSKRQKVKIQQTIKVGKRISAGKYYKVKFTVKAIRKNDPKFTKSKVQTYWEDDFGEWVYPQTFYTVFDYTTGKSLENKKNAAELGVTVKQPKLGIRKWYPKQYYYVRWGKFSSSDPKYYKSWMRNIKSEEYAFVVTYPKTCKDVCVGIGAASHGSVDDPLFNEDYSKWGAYWDGRNNKWGKYNCYKKGTAAYIRLPGDKEKTKPTPSPKPTKTPKVTPTPEPEVTPAVTSTPAPTATPEPTEDTRIAELKGALSKAKSAYETLKSKDTAANWKTYDEVVSTIDSLIAGAESAIRDYAVKNGYKPEDLKEAVLEGVKTQLLGDIYSAYTEGKKERLAYLNAVCSQEIPTVISGKQFSTRFDVKSYLKGTGDKNLSNHAVKSAVTVGTAQGTSVRIKVTFCLGVEQEFVFNVKNTKGIEDDGIELI